MLINTDIYFALKDVDGHYIKMHNTVFKLNNLYQEYSLIEIKMQGKRRIVFKIKCPICDEYHYYIYKINDIINKDVIIMGCEKIGCPVMYMGKKEQVLSIIKKQEQIFKDIYFMV